MDVNDKIWSVNMTSSSLSRGYGWRKKERVFIFSQLRRAVTHTRACHKRLSFDSLIYRLSSLQTDQCSHRGVGGCMERKSTFVLLDEAMELQHFLVVQLHYLHQSG